MFNIFFLAFGAVFMGMAIAILITRKAPGQRLLVPPEDDYDKDPEKGRQVTLADLSQLAEKLIAENNLTIKEKMKNSDHEWYWVAESKNELFAGTYVLALYDVPEEVPFVRLSPILEFKDFIKSIGSGRGLAYTNGFFTKDVLQPLEGPKVGLYNKTKVLAELKRLGGK